MDIFKRIKKLQTIAIMLLILITSGCNVSLASCDGTVFSTCPVKFETRPQPEYTAWSPNGQYLAVVKLNRTVAVVNVKNKHLLANNLAGPYGGIGIKSIQYSRDGEYLIYGVNDINIYDARTYHLVRVIKQPFKDIEDTRPITIWSLSISPDSKTFAVLYRGVKRHNGIAVFNVKSGHVMWKKLDPVQSTKTKNEYITDAGLQFNHDGTKILFCVGGYYYVGIIQKRSYNLEEVDAQTGKINTLIKNIDTTAPDAMAISHAGTLLAVGSGKPGYDANRNRYTKKLNGFKNDNSIKIYDLPTGMLRNVINISGGTISLVFSHNDNYLIVSSYAKHSSKNISVVNVKTGTVVQQLSSEPGLLLGISPRGSILSAVGDTGVFLFNRVKN